MSEPVLPIGASNDPAVRPWGSRWLDEIERGGALGDPALGSELVERGRAYALHDWQLEVHIEPGRSETAARSGPRVRHDVALMAPVLDEDALDQVLDAIAGSGTRTAALLDRELDLNLLDEVDRLGVHLLPDPHSIETSCTCRNWGEVCKHVAALLYLLAEAFDADPFDLLLFRGIGYQAVVDQVTARRSSHEAEHGPPDQQAGTVGGEPAAAAMVSAPDAWHRPDRPLLPDPLAPPTEAGTLPDWGGAPPASAPFTVSGLRSIAADGVRRALEALSGTSDGHLDLDRASDIARRAEAAIELGTASTLASNAALSTRELRARAAAWKVAGTAGIAVLEHGGPVEKRTNDLQFRQGPSGSWFRFEKRSNRWVLTEGPLDELPEEAPCPPSTPTD